MQDLRGSYAPSYYPSTSTLYSPSRVSTLTPLTTSYVPTTTLSQPTLTQPSTLTVPTDYGRLYGALPTPVVDTGLRTTSTYPLTSRPYDDSRDLLSKPLKTSGIWAPTKTNDVYVPLTRPTETYVPTYTPLQTYTAPDYYYPTTTTTTHHHHHHHNKHHIPVNYRNKQKSPKKQQQQQQQVDVDNQHQNDHHHHNKHHHKHHHKHHNQYNTQHNDCADCHHDEHIVLGYWAGIQGLAQPIRYLLEYTGLHYEEHQYTDDQEWSRDKKDTLGMYFTNLPYIIDGQHNKLSESLALMHYVVVRARRFDLLGRTEEDKVFLLSCYGALKDIAQNFSRVFYSHYNHEEDFQHEINQLWDKFDSKFRDFEHLIGNKSSVMDHLTWFDFMLFYYIDMLSHFDQKRMQNYPGLLKYFDRIAEIEQIKNYRESGRLQRYFNGQEAHWRG